ncbi:UNVERIFIED_CONTAM: hypothetical protein GTU68_053790, partial [Idotea baltica]|nr:hypothetical protein [Idotea baltica]
VRIPYPGIPTNRTKLGFHIHTYGVVDNDCITAGGHYNPRNSSHGGPESRKRHVGDLGNIEVDKFGSTTALVRAAISFFFIIYFTLYS